MVTMVTSNPWHPSSCKYPSLWFHLPVASSSVLMGVKSPFLSLRRTPVLAHSFSRVQLRTTPWNLAHQTSPSMGFPRQESWSGLPSPPLGNLPDPEIKPRSPALQADSLPSEPSGKPMTNTQRWFNPFSFQKMVPQPPAESPLVNLSQRKGALFGILCQARTPSPKIKWVSLWS